jgi:hypothetical protein
LELPIDANPYNHTPPMEEHSQCIRDSAASLSIYCKISMVPVSAGGVHAPSNIFIVNSRPKSMAHIQILIYKLL